MCLCGVLAIVQDSDMSYGSSLFSHILLTAKVKSFGGLVTVRFLLDVAEAGMFPGCGLCIILSCRRLD